MSKNLLYIASLSIIAVIVWGLMIKAKYAEYDENYGYAICAFILSLFTTVIIIFIGFRFKHLIKENGIATIIFLIIASPLSLFLFIEFYGRFIGQYFKL